MKYMYLPPQHLHRWVQFSATENSVFRTFEEIFQNALSAKTQEIGAENIHSGILVTFDNYPQANANEQNCQSYCFLLPFPKGQSSLRYTANTFICKCWNWTIQLCCWDWTLLYFYILGRYWVLPFPHSNNRQEKTYSVTATYYYLFILWLIIIIKALCCTLFIVPPTVVYWHSKSSWESL